MGTVAFIFFVGVFLVTAYKKNEDKKNKGGKGQ
jgi:hypothetical protein